MRQGSDRRDLRFAGDREQVRKGATRDHRDEHVRDAGDKATSGPRRGERDQSGRDDPRIGRTRVQNGVANACKESRPRGNGYPEEIAQLRGDDQQGGAGREADDHGMRDEIHQRAETREAHRQLQEAHEERERQHELDVGRAARIGKRRHRREDRQRQRVRRPRHLMPRRSPERGDDDGKHRAVEPVLGRHSGERREGHGLRQHDQRADKARQQVGAHGAAGDAVAPRQKGKELQRKRWHGPVARSCAPLRRRGNGIAPLTACPSTARPAARRSASGDRTGTRRRRSRRSP